MHDTNVREIVSDWLKSHNYEGLCTDECGCRLADLMPCVGCNDGIGECGPAMIATLQECEDLGYGKDEVGTIMIECGPRDQRPFKAEIE
jgi:hypothetical protein